MSEPMDGVQLFARIARELASQSDYSHTVQRIAELSTQLAGCDVAAIWEITDGSKLVLKAATDSFFGEALHSILTGVEEGIAREALTSRRTVVMHDLDTEQRWPAYVAEMKRHALPIRSAVVYSLDLGSTDLGALALYSGKANFFSEELIDIGGVLADHASIALDSARSTAKIGNLELALESNRRIGMAIGVLMALHHLTEQQAFDLLRTASQRNHLKLRQVADQVMYSGEAPSWPPARRRPTD
ncbi:GAF and ANTAR domain-containing protein [Jatrophihabitans telluris]|uniref:GAF and ANTAR domain-containing protein n=1 Tax=Jatrophihabitans telluris TaxID=2038343 RepID=A0ABY4QYP1_9ACTN|nr:GAF and ANTAR domain-containing protein [Jatrophihabitans telluris]UQX88438.1 GAF and ANTAR domain-containing protein [Jatrophihabitans telluris]